MNKAKPDANSQIMGLPFALLLIDPASQIAAANPEAENLIGRSEARLIGMPLSQAIPVEGSDLQTRLMEADARLVVRNIALSLGGAALQININSTPLSGHEGWRLLTLTHAQDNAMDQNDAEAGPLRAPAILAHEIKNPLSAIRGAGQLVERKLAPEDRKLAQLITGEVDRIAGLIDRMQELGSSKTSPLTAVNLHQSVRSAIATIRTGQEHEAVIIEEFDPSLPPIQANREVLEQVLINLLSNAVDATRTCEAPQIIVQTRFVSGFAAKTARQNVLVRLPVEVTIADNGPGVDSALAAHIFEPFVTSKTQGQGLGLALVKKLVNDMLGRVTMKRNERADLTEFRLHLALAEEHRT